MNVETNDKVREWLIAMGWHRDPDAKEACWYPPCESAASEARFTQGAAMMVTMQMQIIESRE